MRNSPQRKQQGQTVTRTQGILYQGPVPPPAILEQLERLLPGAADRIFTMAEKDQAASHDAQIKAHERAKIIEKNLHKENMTALWMAYSICIAFVIGGAFLILNGFEKSGGILIGTTLIGIVVSFLNGQKRRRITTTVYKQRL